MKILFSVLFFCILFSFSAFAQEAEKLDEFSNLACDDHLGRVDFSLSYSQKNPSAIIYVFIYEGKERIYNEKKHKMEMAFPARGSAKAKIDSIKKNISNRNVPIERFKFVEAGFREEMTVEFWLVPNGVDVPKPTPTLEKMKYRKGKAIGFCTDCC